jgi:uncharacterized protein with beta-barrel porin domain
MPFKVRLLLGAAAPLVFVLPAAAQTTISTATTAPVTTTAGDVSVTTAGSIVLPENTANQTAITVNSNNTVTNAGVITIKNGDNTTGVLINQGFTTGFNQTAGSISLADNFDRTDTDGDTDFDGPLATGTGRFGVRVLPGGTMTGNIRMGGGSISVEGNNSAGISVESILNGNYVQDGSVQLTGSNGFGVDFQKNVTGDVLLSGTVITQGEGTVGVRVLGDVSGEFMVDGAITSTGFTSTTEVNYVDPDSLLPTDKTIAQRRDADDLLIGGPALQIRGDLNRGLLINGAAVGGVDPTPDVKDVVQNFNVNRAAGAVSSFGSAPAIDVSPLDGAAGADIVFGKVRESVRDTLDDDADSNLDEIIGVFNYDFGFMNRGIVTASGLNVGIAGTGIRIAGSADGTHTTTIAGGIFNSGQLITTAFEANAIGYDIGRGAITPQLINTGSISVGINTEDAHTATAVLIRQGASMPSVTNNGFLSAQVRGWDGNAIAFQDLSGTVTSFTNTSRVVTGHTDDDTTDTITSGLGREIALDFRANATGVTLTQTDTVDNARIFGDVLFGSGADRFDLLSGQVFGDIDYGTGGADILNINSAGATGDVVFRGATAGVTLANASFLRGNLAFGAAAANLTLSGGSTYEGALTNSGAGRVALSLNNASLTNTSAQTLQVSTMNLTNGSKLFVNVDSARLTGGLPVYVVNNGANLAADTRISPVFDNVVLSPFSIRVLQANALTVGGPVASMLEANPPFLYNMSLSQTGNNIDLNLRVKTATELGLSGYQSGAYTAVLNLLQNEPTIGSAFTEITNQTTFLEGFNDLLPPNDTSVMKVLATNANAAMGATGRRLELVSDKPNAPGGAWLEEFGLYHHAGVTDNSLSTSGGGFGVAGGFDLISSRDRVLGAFFSLESVKLEEEERTNAPFTAAQTTIGAYGGWRSGALAVNGAVGYGFVEFDDKRDVAVSTLTDRLEGNWRGNTITAGARATYTIPAGFLQFKPYVAADYLSLTQEGYTETAQTNADLSLIVGDADSHLATASAGIALAAHFAGGASDFRIDPEISVGYRQVLSFGSSPGSARFLNETTNFQLSPGQEPDGAIVAGVGFNIGSEYLNMKVGYDAEFSEQATTHYGSITLRLAFW